MTPTFDKAAICRRAWAIARQGGGRVTPQNPRTRIAFARAMSIAWGEAKAHAAGGRPVCDLSANERELVGLENARRLDDATAERVAVLRAVVEAEAVEVRRATIAAAGGRIVAVTFTKADGTVRTMKVQPAALRSRVKGENASASARKAVLTRNASHPHLMPVWDVEARAVRSVNLATVSRIVADGMAHAYP